jgi:hypothetical protein
MDETQSRSEHFVMPHPERLAALRETAGDPDAKPRHFGDVIDRKYVHLLFILKLKIPNEYNRTE